tara:strand:- start:71 stop:412 length:342 start_codon:yes stop_codon:yes gene_type:complete
MALTKEILYDKTEIVTEYKIIQVRKRIVIKEDDVQISEKFERYSLDCGTLKGGLKADGVTPADDAQDLVDNPLDKEPDGVTAIPDEVKALCNLLWTDTIKAAWRTKLIAQDTE